jgi:hypothetical protein
LRAIGGVTGENVGRDLVNKILENLELLQKNLIVTPNAKVTAVYLPEWWGPFEIPLAIVWLTPTRTKAALMLCSLICC